MIERWAFTQSDLRNPAACRSDDELNATVPNEDPVIVRRNGSVTNLWYDGAAGVPADTAAIANEDESPFDPVTGELADMWRDVEVDDAGKFACFA